MMPVCIAAKERVQRNPSAQRGAVCLRRRAVRLLTPLHGHCAHIAKGGRAGAEVPPPEGGGTSGPGHCKSSSQTQSRDKRNQKVHLNKSQPQPTAVPRNTCHACASTIMAACALATCHSVCQASHAAASPAREKLPSRGGGGGGGGVGAQWGGVDAVCGHRTIAPWASHPGPCPGSATPSPCRHGPGAMARAPWPWRDRRRLTARLASLCGLGRARFAPQRRHTRSQAPDTHQARSRSWRLPSRCTLLRARALRRCRAAAPRAQRQARKGVACAQPVNAVADREGADHHVVREEGNGSLDAVPTSSSRVAPAPCHEARQEQQQRRQPAGAARAVRVHERRPPERDSETPQLGGAGRGDQVACRCCQVAAVASQVDAARQDGCGLRALLPWFPRKALATTASPTRAYPCKCGVLERGVIRSYSRRCPPRGCSLRGVPWAPSCRHHAGPVVNTPLLDTSPPQRSRLVWQHKPTTTGATPLPKHRPTAHAKQITAQQEPGQPGSRLVYK